MRHDNLACLVALTPAAAKWDEATGVTRACSRRRSPAWLTWQSGTGECVIGAKLCYFSALVGKFLSRRRRTVWRADGWSCLAADQWRLAEWHTVTYGDVSLVAGPNRTFFNGTAPIHLQDINESWTSIDLLSFCRYSMSQIVSSGLGSAIGNGKGIY